MSNKLLTQVCVVFIICLALCYAIASVMNGSFDFSTWKESSRLLTGILSTIFSSCIAAMVWDEGTKENDNEDS